MAAGELITLTATPTLDTSAYISGDSLHTAVIDFAGASGASRSGYVEKLVIIEKKDASNKSAGELWLFSDTVTPAAANAAHSISDADAALCVGVITFGTYYASALNAVSVATGVNLPYVTLGTSLYGILVTRGTPTYGAADLVVKLTVTQS